MGMMVNFETEKYIFFVRYIQYYVYPIDLVLIKPAILSRVIYFQVLVDCSDH